VKKKMSVFLSAKPRKIIFGSISTILLFVGFYFFGQHLALQQGLPNFQRDTESLVIGRMVKSRQDGLFSAGGLTGAGIQNNIHVDWISSEDVKNQYSAYLNRFAFTEYSPYMSQIGGQALVFSTLDKILPFLPQTKLEVFYIITSFFSAIALTAIILWFYAEFGLLVATFVLFSFTLSPWLIILGRNLWWSIWAFYLPMIAVMGFLRYKKVPDNHHFMKLGALVFITVLIKCFINGYEFITTTLIMMVTPFIYYGILEKLNARKLLKQIFIAILGSALAISLSLAVLSFQIASLNGESVIDGINHITESYQKRTHGDAQNFSAAYASSLNARTTDVILKYVEDSFIDINKYIPVSNSFISMYILKIRYLYLILLFLATSTLVLLQKTSRITRNEKRKSIALVITTWFSVLAPLSWYIIFKAHAFVHTHLDNIVWQMPFIFFGFAVCGLAFKGVFSTQTGLKSEPVGINDMQPK
jgi:hypothetical protein